MSPLIIKQKISLNGLQLRRWTAGLTCLIVFVGILYLGQINVMATKGYELKALEVKKAELMKANKDLEVKVAEAQASENLLKRIDELQLVRVSNVSYINALSTNVALK